MPTAFTLKVPATTANLGSGFDCLGLALAWYNTLTAEPAPALELSIGGEGEASLPRDARNLVVRAMQRACEAMRKPLPNVRLDMQNQIPLARGLGSSAAAVIGGLMAANFFYEGPLSHDDLLRLATQMEGHPDNVAPALLGGLCVVSMDRRKPIAVKIDWPPMLRCIVFVPDTKLSTAKARAVLPKSVPRDDAVFNTGRAALWVAAITQQRFDLLALATQDRLHQPYRAKLIAGFDEMISAAMQAGARGAFLSGAGSSIAALADDAYEKIAEAMQRAADEAGQSGRVLKLGADQQGAKIEI